MIVNADTGKEEGKISGLKLSHGIAVVPELARRFISDGAQGKAIIFDLKSLKVVGEANTAPDADCILYDPASKHVFTSMVIVTVPRSSIRRLGRMWAH